MFLILPHPPVSPSRPSQKATYLTLGGVLRSYVLTWAIVPLVACKPVEPAPTEIDDLFHFFWDELDDGTDETLARGMDNLHLAVSADTTLDDHLEGTVSYLSAAQGQRVGITTQDPGQATGVFIVKRIPCTPERMETLLIELEQDEYYTGVYDSFERQYTTDETQYLSGETHVLGWETTYASTILGVSYEANTVGTLRRIPDGTEPRTGWIARAVLSEPAVFGSEANWLRQDYHMEMYWQDGDDILHAYALWKDTRMLTFEDEGEATQRLMVNNMAQWDDGTATLCAREDLDQP